MERDLETAYDNLYSASLDEIEEKLDEFIRSKRKQIDLKNKHRNNQED